jgi:hypothetical protein
MRKVNEIIGADLPAAPKEKGRRGYLAREFVQCGFPHSDPKSLPQYERTDGNFTLRIIADPKYGLPWGPVAKLIAIWITSEVKRTGEAELNLGNSINQFLHAIELDPSTGGGKRSDLKRLKNQLYRLLNCVISFDYEENSGMQSVTAWSKMLVAEDAVLWWDFSRPEERYLFDSKIIIHDKFFRAIMENAVPIDITMAGKLKKSPLALDLFIWTTYRLYRLKPGQQITVSTRELHKQFGSDYKRERDFKTYLGAAITKIKGDPERELAPVWKNAPLRITERGLELTGIPLSQLPVQPEIKGGLLATRHSNDPFEFSTKDLMQLDRAAKGWDIRVMRRNWKAWCEAEGIVPNVPKAHFLGFIREHIKRNGSGL